MSAIKGIKNRVFQLLAHFAPGARSVRVWLHRQRGVKMGKNVWIGYDVVLAKINGAKATITPFMTGFLDPQTDAFWGRPVDVMQMPDGAMLVSDEQNGAIYRVSYTGKVASQ